MTIMNAIGEIAAKDSKKTKISYMLRNPVQMHYLDHE